jgi:subtilase family serine protease
MRLPVCSFFCLFVSPPNSNSSTAFNRIRLLPAFVLLAAAALAGPALSAQAANRITQAVDTSRAQALPNHHPLWANPANSTGLAPANLPLDQLTLVLSRSPQQEQAFEQFLADQQNPASPDYHHWLTPAEVGQRFGLSDQDIATITGWLQSQGLHVNWVAPSRIFIGFGGTAADIGRAFQTEMRYYMVNGVQRLSIDSDPQIPTALAPAIKAIRGLYTIDEQPAHHAAVMQSNSPEVTTSGGYHFIGPGDFSAIYDLPNGLYGSGQTIGIVGRSRTNPADFNNFKALIGPGFTNPTEIVPTTFGGIDPGPALTAPPTGSVSAGDQGEATLDVLRAGSTAWGAQILLVVATAASGGIGADAQYLVQTTPVPAQVMTISFGLCESAAGSAGVTFWDTLFQQAAAEGISTFVSSGDSGASGCDVPFAAPSASPQANSPNYICSSSYATCVGGTEFNDTANPSTYWNVAYLGQTAHGYIPEGGWNESWDGTTSTVASSGGGVSTVVPTPSWQTGTGVPADRSGRYTPDVSFSSSMHDGYFGCFAAGGGDCVVGTDGSFRFMAAAPAMAGVAALLDQNLGGAQGNLNPGLYQMAVSAPTAFHDVTVATSGVTTCDLNTPSICNNSIGGPSGLSGGQPGFAVGVGYDEVTGLGSLNAGTFVYAYGTTSKVMKPALTLSYSQTVNTWEPIYLVAYINGSGYSPAPTGTITFTVGSYTSSPIAMPYGQALVTVPAGTIPVGTYTESAVYIPDAASAQIYQSVSATRPFTITVPPKVPPTLALTTSQTIISNSQSMSVGVVVNAGQYYSTPAGAMVPYYPMPTGTVALTSGSYTSAPVVLANGNATVIVPAGSLAAGNDVLTVTYTPDVAGSSTFLVASSQTYVQNEGDRITPSVFPSSSPSNPTTAQAVVVQVRVDGFTGNPTPTGAVVLSSGSYASAATALAGGTASITIPAGALSPGLDTLTATYTPDASSSALYANTWGSNTIGVTLAVKITPAVAVTSLTVSPTTVQPLSLAITVSGGASNPAPSGFVRLQNPGYNSVDAALTGGSATASIPAASLSGGTDTINATYWPDTNGAYSYNGASGTIAVTVAKATPVVTITPSLTSMTTLQPLQVFANVSGGSGTPTASGTVTFKCGSFTSDPLYVYPPGNTVSITVPAGSLAPGTVTLTASYTGDSTYTAATGIATVTVTMPANAGFGIAATNLSIPSGAASGNYSTVTVTPANGFVGTVALTAAITASPAGAQYPPTLSFGVTSPVTITSAASGTATLTVSTTASQKTTCTAANQIPRGIPWYARGGAVVACMLLFGIAPQRRRWRTMLGMLILFVALTSGMLACGGGSQSTACNNVVTPGTTAGSYIVTVTGTSGSTTATNMISLTVI